MAFSFDDLIEKMDEDLLSPTHGFGVTVHWLDGNAQWQPINATHEQVANKYGQAGRENQTVTKALEVTEQDAQHIDKGHSIKIDSVDYIVDRIEYPESKLPRLHLVLPLPENTGDGGHRWQHQ